MKNNYLLLVLLATLFWGSGCYRDQGSFVEYVIPVGNFDGLHTDGPANVFLTQGPLYEVVISGNQEAVDRYTFEVRNGKLCIDHQGGGWGRSPEIFIIMPDLKHVESRGSGDVVSRNKFVRRGDLRIELRSSGDIDLAIDVNDITVENSGSGYVYLEGDVDLQDVDLNASGDYRAFNLASNRCKIRLDGSGNAEVYVYSNLQAVLRGSGNLFYRGFPSIQVRGNGSGEVYDAN